MKMLDWFGRLGISSFAFVLACQESDRPLGQLPEDGGDSSDGGSAPAGSGATGAGASANGGNGGAAGAGASANARVYGPVTAASIVLLKSGDPAQSTPPVLAATEDGVVVAGASADPDTVGVAAFAAGVESEAFVGHLTVEGFTWSKPLLSSGLPGAIATTPSGSFVIEGPYLPDEARVSLTDVSTARVLYGIGETGTIAYDSRLSFDVDTVGGSLAVTGDGSILFGGGAEIANPFILTTKRGVVVKCTNQGARIWEKSFSQEPLSATVNAVAVLSNGDIVAGGNFDTSNRIPDTGTLTAPASIVRLTPDGEKVWSIDIDSGQDVVTIGALLALEDGEFLVAGSTVADFVLGTEPVDVPEPTSQDVVPPFTTFIARIGENRQVRWVTLDPDSYWPRALARDDYGTAFVALEPNFGAQAARVYLRALDLANGSVRQSFETTGSDYTFASSVSWKNDRLWVAGAYRGPVDFGGGASYNADPAGVFVAHLEPQ